MESASLEKNRFKFEIQYGRELRQLRSANEQIAFYVDQQNVGNDGNKQALLDTADEEDPSGYTLALPQHIQTSLDPFVALPGNVTEYERLRVQLYSQNLGAGIFGVSDNPKYSPTAATGISTAIYSDVGREWICILVDQTLNVLRGGTQTQDLIRQKAHGFRRLNEAIRMRHDHYQEALMALTICGLTEFRFGNSQSRNMHTTATDMFLKSRGSLRNAMAAAPNVEPFYVSAQFGFGRCHFASIDKLEEVKAQWKSDLLGILNKERPSCNTNIQIPLSAKSQRQYRTQEARIARIVVASTKTITPPTMFAAGMQLNLLTEVAWTILQFGSNWDSATKFFNRVEYFAESSLIGGGTGDKSFELRAAALGTMVSRARRDVLGNFHADRLEDADVTITQLHINALKMFHYLEPEGRMLLLAKFVQWFQDEGVSESNPIMSEVELSDLEAQINATWFQTHIPY